MEFTNLNLDTTLGGSTPSDSIVSSQKAIKTYIDNTISPSYKSGDTYSISSSVYLMGIVPDENALKFSISLPQNVSIVASVQDLNFKIKTLDGITLEQTEFTIHKSELYYEGALDVVCTNNSNILTINITPSFVLSWEPIENVLIFMDITKLDITFKENE